MDYDEIKRRKRPNIESVQIVLEPEWAIEVAEAQAALRRAQQQADLRQSVLEALQRTDDVDGTADAAKDAAKFADDRDAAQAKVDALIADAGDKVVVFRLRGLAAYEIDELIEQFPPTREQKDEARKAGNAAPPWNPETYPPALVHTALVEPEWSLEQVQAIWRDPDWNVAEIRALYAAADGTTMQRRVVDLGEG